MSLTPSGWHTRFLQQARWTKELRQYLFARAGLSATHRVLDVGCGTGVLHPELISGYHASVIGVDNNRQMLYQAHSISSATVLINGDAHHLPFADRSFDLCLCHFLLMWVANPVRVLEEMVRLTQQSGVVFALAEPDYGGRVDYPPELERLGVLQEISLRQQGADTRLGRRLAAMLHQVGLKHIEYGVLGGQWISPPPPEDWLTEWGLLLADLEFISSNMNIVPSREELDELALVARQASLGGERVLYVPTFYAWGKV